MDEIKVMPEETPQDPEHEAKMIALVDGEEKPTVEEDKPLLAGKYTSEEELQQGVLELLKKTSGSDNLEKLYKDLEYQMSKPDKSGEDTPEVETPKEDTKGEEDNDTPSLSVLEEYQNEFFKTGELSEDSYQALADKGFPKEFVDTFIEGQKAIAERTQQEFYSSVGGEDNYMSMIQWAENNLSEQEINTFNKAMNSQDYEMIKLAVDGLHARYSKVKGNEPNGLILGTSSGVSNVGSVYESISQLTADMNDPRYESDPAYRKKVQDKLSKSNIL